MTINKSIQSLAVILIGSLFIVCSSVDVEAGCRHWGRGRQSNCDDGYQQNQQQNRDRWPWHVHTLGDDHVSLAVGRVEDRIHPPNPSPCLTVTRHGCLTTIR